MPKTLPHATAIVATVAAGLLALRTATPAGPMPAPIDPTAQALRITGDYRSWASLDRPSGLARTPQDVPPGHGGSRPEVGAAGSGPHEEVLYRIHARDPAAYRGLESGAPQAHQAVVMETFEAVPYRMPGPGRVPPDVISVGDRLVRPGAVAERFLMWHDASDAAREERWTYAVVSASGEVTASGRPASCVECHAAAPHAGLFGL